MFDYLFFDLDGTLTDPAQGITNSFIHALKFYGIEIPSYEKLCTYIGPPLVTTFQKEYGFSEEKSMEAVGKYREYFAQKGLFENKVYEEIPTLLQKLTEMGKTLIVATSKPEEYSIKILEHFNLSKYFKYICGSNMDESRSKKEEVIAYAMEKCSIKPNEKDKILMIGDREHDIIGAKKNNLKSCGVLFGYGNQKELSDAGADYIISTPLELLSII